jgi:GNAT superfamily N-acetyltransferase
LHIDVLWVKDEYRKHKYGSKLLAKIEEEARNLGAKLSHVETYQFQALTFYQKQGYQLFHAFDNYTGNGNKLYLLQKSL